MPAISINVLEFALPFTVFRCPWSARRVQTPATCAGR